MHALDTVEDMHLRLSNILKPPYSEIKVPILSLAHMEGKDMGVHFGSQDLSVDYGDMYGWIPITIDEAIINNLRTFRHALRLQQTQRRKSKANSTAQVISANPNPVKKIRARILREEGGGDASSDEEGSEASDIDDLLLSTTALLKPTDAACIAAFAVLMKHVTGKEKFVMGVNTHLRDKDVIAGPLTETLPLKFDLSHKKVTFEHVFGKTLRQLRKARKFGMHAPALALAQELKTSMDFPVQFEFITQAETDKWKKDGLRIEDLWSEDGVVYQEAQLRMEKMWSVDEHDKFDLKVILVESDDNVYGGFRYRKDKFDDEKIIKWIQKYELILHNIEYSPRKIYIANMISRLYQSVWANSTNSLVDLTRRSSMNLASLASLSSMVLSQSTFSIYNSSFDLNDKASQEPMDDIEEKSSLAPSSNTGGSGGSGVSGGSIRPKTAGERKTVRIADDMLVKTLSEVSASSSIE
jgi:hypothetical protein